MVLLPGGLGQGPGVYPQQDAADPQIVCVVLLNSRNMTPPRQSLPKIDRVEPNLAEPTFGRTEARCGRALSPDLVDPGREVAPKPAPQLVEPSPSLPQPRPKLAEAVPKPSP